MYYIYVYFNTVRYTETLLSSQFFCKTVVKIKCVKKRVRKERVR
jgi:hypothetical protein